jgi:prevent-host-death family protein
MINLSRDIQSLSTFKRNTNELIIQMKETGNPVVLTVNGKAELVVQDAESYQKLLDAVEHLETIIGI